MKPVTLYPVVTGPDAVCAALLICVTFGSAELEDVVYQSWYTTDPQTNVDLYLTRAPANTRVWAEAYWDIDARTRTLFNLIWGPTL